MMRPLVNFRAIMPMNTRSRFIDDFFNENYRRNLDYQRLEDNAITVPSANIKTGNKGYTIELAAPGFDREEFSVEVNNDVLTLSGERKVSEDNEQPYSRKEHNYISFTRSFALPESVDEARIDANYHNGILRISIPVKDEVATTQKPRRIEIG